MGFDYWALGHVHKRQVHCECPWVVMPGMPQGRDIGEAGPKSASLLTISDGKIHVDEVHTSVVEFFAASLDIFGHFTDRHFDFGAIGEGPDFHIIHGANESGKTTTMEAVLRLLYGFAHREGYAFKHQRKNLQVSGVLEIDGDPRGFTRLPGRSGTLIDEAGAVMPETALGAYLGGLSEEDYRKLLCLDDDTIERGGEEIAQARGDIGRLLFSAAAGVADLSTVLEGVREDAEAIWRRRASKTRMAHLKRELAQVERDIRDRDVSASAWRGLKKALAGAQEAENDARKVRTEINGKSARVASRRRALPLLGEIDALAERTAPFADYPAQLDFDPEYLVGLIAGERQAKADIERLTGEIEAWTTTLDDLDRNPERVTLSGELDALDDLRARDVAAGLDLERRRDLVRETEAAMAAAARDLRAGDGTDPRRLVLSPADIAGLEQAGEALRTAQATAAQEAREVAALVERHERAREAHDKAVAQGSTEIGIGDRAIQCKPKYHSETVACETAGKFLHRMVPCDDSRIEVAQYSQFQTCLAPHLG